MLISSLTYTCELWSVYHTILGGWGMERIRIQSSSLPLLRKLGFLKDFQIKT